MVVERDVAVPTTPSFELVEAEFPPLMQSAGPPNNEDASGGAVIGAEVAAETSMDRESAGPSTEENSSGGAAIGAEVAAETPMDQDADLESRSSKRVASKVSL